MRRPAVPEFADCFNFILLRMCILEGRLVLARFVTLTFYSTELALTAWPVGLFSALIKEDRLIAESSFSFCLTNDPLLWVPSSALFEFCGYDDMLFF